MSQARLQRYQRLAVDASAVGNHVFVGTLLAHEMHGQRGHGPVENSARTKPAEVDPRQKPRHVRLGDVCAHRRDDGADELCPVGPQRLDQRICTWRRWLAGWRDGPSAGVAAAAGNGALVVAALPPLSDLVLARDELDAALVAGALGAVLATVAAPRACLVTLDAPLPAQLAAAAARNADHGWRSK